MYGFFFESEFLGSGGTLLANKGWVAEEQPFFILYGDNLTDLNLSKRRPLQISADLETALFEGLAG